MGWYPKHWSLSNEWRTDKLKGVKDEDHDDHADDSDDEEAKGDTQ